MGTELAGESVVPLSPLSLLWPWPALVDALPRWSLAPHSVRSDKLPPLLAVSEKSTVSIYRTDKSYMCDAAQYHGCGFVPQHAAVRNVTLLLWLHPTKFGYKTPLSRSDKKFNLSHVLRVPLPFEDPTKVLGRVIHSKKAEKGQLNFSPSRATL